MLASQAKDSELANLGELSWQLDRTSQLRRAARSLSDRVVRGNPGEGVLTGCEFGLRFCAVLVGVLLIGLVPREWLGSPSFLSNAANAAAAR